MRGTPDRQLSMLSSLSTEDLIPTDHPIRRIRVVVDTVLAELDEVFDAPGTQGREQWQLEIEVPQDQLTTGQIVVLHGRLSFLAEALALIVSGGFRDRIVDIAAKAPTGGSDQDQGIEHRQHSDPGRADQPRP